MTGNKVKATMEISILNDLSLYLAILWQCDNIITGPRMPIYFLLNFILMILIKSLQQHKD